MAESEAALPCTNCSCACGHDPKCGGCEAGQCVPSWGPMRGPDHEPEPEAEFEHKGSKYGDRLDDGVTVSADEFLVKQADIDKARGIDEREDVPLLPSHLEDLKNREVGQDGPAIDPEVYGLAQALIEEARTWKAKSEKLRDALQNCVDFLDAHLDEPMGDDTLRTCCGIGTPDNWDSSAVRILDEAQEALDG
jgi:hypothetical protein